VLEQASSQVRQGEVARVAVAPGAKAVSARLLETTVPLFPEADGVRRGLIPVGVQAEPGPAAIEILDTHGTVIESAEIEIVDARFTRQNIRVTGAVSSLKPAPGEMETIRSLRAAVTGVRYWSEPFTPPTADCMNSPFGVLRFHNGKFTGNFHRGVDLRSRAGEAVRAATPGVVRIARMYQLHGGTVGLDHGQGVTSIYIHLSKIEATEGQLVQAGDIVGRVGATGFATGPHLHWGLYVHGEAVNPLQWLPETARCE
jgi:murein DD-endopeptidase MepM/ murein hydrolase activator NlpD